MLREEDIQSTKLELAEKLEKALYDLEISDSSLWLAKRRIEKLEDYLEEDRARINRVIDVMKSIRESGAPNATWYYNQINKALL